MAKLGMLLAAMLSPLLIAAYIMADDWMGLYLVLSLGAWPAISFWAHNRRIQGKPSAASDCLIRNEVGRAGRTPSSLRSSGLG